MKNKKKKNSNRGNSPGEFFFFSLLYPVAYNIFLIYGYSIYILFMWNRSSKSNLTMMIISDLLAVAMLIIVNLLIMIDMVTISSRSVPAGDNVKTAY